MRTEVSQYPAGLYLNDIHEFLSSWLIQHREPVFLWGKVAFPCLFVIFQACCKDKEYGKRNRMRKGKEREEKVSRKGESRMEEFRTNQSGKKNPPKYGGSILVRSYQLFLEEDFLGAEGFALAGADSLTGAFRAATSGTTSPVILITLGSVNPAILIDTSLSK